MALDRNVMPGESLYERIPLTPAQRIDKLAEIDRALNNARLRRIAYLSDGLFRDAEIQDNIIDRRLRERFEVMKG